MPFEPEDLVPIAQHVVTAGVTSSFPAGTRLLMDGCVRVGLQFDGTSHHGGDGVVAEA